MKSIKRHLLNALPLTAIALVIATTYPKLFPPRAALSDDAEHKPKVVTVPPHRDLPQSERRRVLSVHDGDSITLEARWGKEKIRLCGVDAPELSQNLGVQSRDNLRSLIAAAGNQVIVTPIEKDRYDRTVAEVFVVMGDGKEKFLQEEQLGAGLTRVYPAFVANCPNREVLEQAEEMAKAKSLGVWGDLSSIPPWEWRKQQRQSKES